MIRDLPITDSITWVKALKQLKLCEDFNNISNKTSSVLEELLPCVIFGRVLSQFTEIICNRIISVHALRLLSPADATRFEGSVCCDQYWHLKCDCQTLSNSGLVWLTHTKSIWHTSLVQSYPQDFVVTWESEWNEYKGTWMEKWSGRATGWREGETFTYVMFGNLLISIQLT